MESLLASFDPPKHFDCAACGAPLAWDAQRNALLCSHCGSVTPVVSTTSHAGEMDLHSALNKASNGNAYTKKAWAYRCPRCGAETTLTDDTASYRCTQCKGQVVNPGAFASLRFLPSMMAPFDIDRADAANRFKAWVGKSFWSPNDFDKLARPDAWRGAYLPFWTFDAHTVSQWSGEGGRQVSYTRNGKTETRLEWEYRSGVHEEKFDDVLVEASSAITPEEIRKLLPYDTHHLKPFEPAYIAGWEAEVCAPDEGLDRSAALAKEEMGSAIEAACTDACRIDTYRNLEVHTTYSNETFTHILLPVWVCAYRYKDKAFRFFINGQTGAICGQKPVSTTKVVLAVLLVIFVLLAIYFLNARG